MTVQGQVFDEMKMITHPSRWIQFEEHSHFVSVTCPKAGKIRIWTLALVEKTLPDDMFVEIAPCP